MTISTDGRDQIHLSEQVERDTSRIRRLRVVVIVLAILALALVAALVATAVVGDDEGTATGAPDEVIQLIEDYPRAFEEQDVELALSLITEDFLSNADVYNPNTAKPAFTARATPESMSQEIRSQVWNVERSGDPLVAGDGPWVVAVRETWTDRFNRDEGARLYVIIEENGAPKIAGYYWVGIWYDVIPDFGD